jgi:hypothetical protein
LSEQGVRVLRAVREIGIQHLAAGNLDVPTLPEPLERYLSAALSVGWTEVEYASAQDAVWEQAAGTADEWFFRLTNEQKRITDVTELAARAKQDGVASLSPLQVLTLVLVWLVMLSTPVVQQHLPPAVQAVLTDEVGTVGLGLAVTALIIQHRKR